MRSRTWSASLAWRIEFTTAAKKELAKLDPPVARRLVAFLRERLGVVFDPAQDEGDDDESFGLAGLEEYSTVRDPLDGVLADLQSAPGDAPNAGRHVIVRPGNPILIDKAGIGLGLRFGGIGGAVARTLAAQGALALARVAGVLPDVVEQRVAADRARVRLEVEHRHEVGRRVTHAGHGATRPGQRPDLGSPRGVSDATRTS